MAQINLNVTPDFDSDLQSLMKARGLKSKSEAIRLAVREATAAAIPAPKHNLSVLIGLIDRVPGPDLTDKSGEELLAELDREMEEKLDRFAGKV